MRGAKYGHVPESSVRFSSDAMYTAETQLD